MIYVIGRSGCEPPFIKIGRAKKPQSRVRELQVGNHEKLSIYAIFDWPDEYEELFHNMFQPYRVFGEWFKTGPEMDGIMTLCSEMPEVAKYLLKSKAKIVPMLPKPI